MQRFIAKPSLDQKLQREAESAPSLPLVLSYTQKTSRNRDKGTLTFFECFEWGGFCLLVDNSVFCFHWVRISFCFWWRSWIVYLRYFSDISTKIVYSPIHIEYTISFSPVDVSFFDDPLIFGTCSFNHGNCCSVSELIQACDVNFFR